MIASARQPTSTGWSAPYVRDELARLLGQHVGAHNPKWAVASVFERVTPKLPAGVRLYYDGTAYVPPDYSGDVIQAVRDVMVAEIQREVRLARPGTRGDPEVRLPGDTQPAASA